MSILNEIIHALDCILLDIYVKESKLEKFERVLQRMALQIQYDGFCSIQELGELEKSIGIWTDLLKSMRRGKDEVIDKLELFYDSGYMHSIVNYI